MGLAIVAGILLAEPAFEIRLTRKTVVVVVKTDMIERYTNYRAQAVELEGKLEDALNLWWARQEAA